MAEQCLALMDPIKHVIVLMFENRSFEHLLGYRTFNPESPHCLSDHEGSEYCQESGASRILNPDPGHELSNVLNQLLNHNTGFVMDYEDIPEKPTPNERKQIMKFFAADELP